MPPCRCSEPARKVLLDDASGRIEYRAGVLPPAQADAWFVRLQADIPWRAQRRQMYERELDVPRLTASYRLDDPQLPPTARRRRRRWLRPSSAWASMRSA
jgi:alkylated DNA repair dioxygenase AlkB